MASCIQTTQPAIWTFVLSMAFLSFLPCCYSFTHMLELYTIAFFRLSCLDVSDGFVYVAWSAVCEWFLLAGFLSLIWVVHGDRM